jgi:hypothetical protein
MSTVMTIKLQALSWILTFARQDGQPDEHAFATLINSLAVLGLTPDEMCDACVDMGFAAPSGNMIVANLTRLAPWTASAA